MLFYKPFSELTQAEVTALTGSTAYRNAVANPLYSEFSRKFYDAYHLGVYQDLRTVFFRKERPVGFLIATGKEGVLDYFGLPLRIEFVDDFANEPFDSRKEMYGSVFRYFASLKDNFSVDKAVFANQDWLLGKYHSRIISVQNFKYAFIDLRSTIEEIQRGVRKSYRSLINWGKRNIVMETIEKKNPDRQKFLEFKQFHEKVSGRKTRSDETWEIQFEQIRAGEAFLLLGYYEGQMMSGSFVIHSNTEAYYGVGVYDREQMAQKKPMAHSVLLDCILEAKKLGCSNFVLGNSAIDGTRKEKDIDVFKAGFTGSILIQPVITCGLEGNASA